MKNLIIKVVMLTFLLMSSALNAQSCPVPEPLDKTEVLGTWQGSFTQDGEFKTVVVNFKSEKKGLKTTLSIPSISKNKIVAETNICQSEELHIKFSINEKEYELTGRPKNGSISGKLTAKKSSLFANNTELSINEIFTIKKLDNS